MPSYEPSKPRKRRVLRTLAIVFFVLIALVGALVWFAPSLAGSMLRSQIASKLPAGMSADIGDIRLGWTGTQRLDHIAIVGPNQSVETDLSCSIDRGLWQILRGGGDLGTITLEGDLILRPDKMPKTAAESKQAGGGAIQFSTGASVSGNLPPTFNAALDIPSLNITVEEDGKPATTVAAKGKGSLASGKPVLASFTANAARSGASLGSADIDLTINNLIAASGVVDPDAASINATVALKDFATSVLAGFAGPGADLRQVFGETITADVRAQGDIQQLDAVVHLDTPRVKGDAKLAVRDRVLSATEPVTLRVDSAGLAAGVPSIAEALAEQGIVLAAAPHIDARLTTLRIELPEGGFEIKSYDARGVQLVADINLSEATATIPGEKFGQPASLPKQLRTAPGTLRLDATKPADGARLTGALQAFLDGQPAGNIDIDLTATNLLDANGVYRRDAVPTLAGKANIRQLPAALVQSFVADSGIDLPTDFGPLLSLDLAAEPAPGADYRVNLSASGDNLQTAGVLTVAGQSITADPGFRVIINHITPTAARFLQGQPIQVSQDTGARIVFDRLSVNRDELKKHWAAPGALDTAFNISFAPHSLQLLREGQPPLTVVANEPTSYSLDLKDGIANIRGQVPQADLDGRSLVRNLAVTARATDLASASPAINATVIADQFHAEAIGALTDNDKLLAALRDLGPSFRVELQPVYASGKLEAPIKITGSKAAATGHIAYGEALKATFDIDTPDPSWLDHLAGQPGAGQDTLGGAARLHLDLTAPKAADGSFGQSASAAFTLASPRMNANGDANLAGDTLMLNTKADLPDTRFLDGILNKPAGFMNATIGASAKLDARSTLRRSPGGQFGEAIEASATLAAPKLKSSGPIALSITPAAIAITQPVTLDWLAEPAFVESLLRDKNDPQKAPPVRLAKATQFRVAVRSLNLPRTEQSNQAPRVDLSINGSDVALILPDGTTRTYSGLALALKNSPTPDAIDATLALNDGQRRVIDAQLTGSDLNNGFARGAWTGTAKIDQFATPVLDALAGKGNTNIADMLGPFVNATIQVQQFPRENATIALDAQSPRAAVRYAGQIRQGMIVNTQQADLVLAEITREFGFKLAKFIPVFGGVTKDPTKHTPAHIAIPMLVIPLDFDPKGVRADMTIDPGVVEYDLAFNGLLNEPMLQTKGRAGDSQKPFRMLAESGVIRSEGLSISVGEYEIPAQSAIDLNLRTEDLRLGLPIGALANELARDGSGLLEGITIGATRQGPLDAENKWKLDFSEAVKPENLIKKGLDELFKGIGG